MNVDFSVVPGSEQEKMEFELEHGEVLIENLGAEIWEFEILRGWYKI